ncbi:MAG: glycosyltransferase family A protein [Desulfobulbaceae bacterium]|nr:glycosyltransferase family A protein [Desulfobulbaceae bacterium]
MKLISVVIPCYNQGEFLEEAVESVLSQSYPHFEIVVVNDGSTDPYTIALLDSFDKPKCRVLQTGNQGLPAARNNGIRSTGGEYICCLDADDKYHPDYFRKAVEVFASDSEFRYGAVPAWVKFFGSRDTLWKTIGHNTEGFEPFLQGLRNNIQSATMFRRICWEKIGGYDESMTLGYEDWDFWIKMLNLGYQWFCIEEPLIYYRQKDQSMVTRADEVRPRLLGALIKNNHGFYAKNLVPMLLARDHEVRMLQKEVSVLAESLAAASGKGSPAIKKSGKASHFQQFRQSLRKLFPSAGKE